VSAAVGCPKSGGGAAAVAAGPTHTLIYGGDVFAARRLNAHLFDDEARPQILGDLKPLLATRDLAMLNLEGMVTLGGSFYMAGTSTYYFRAHPLLLDELKAVGVDLVTIGNNHMPDYGPEALVEMTDRLTLAGIGYAGAGTDPADARRPVYRQVGEVVVAVIGGEMTYARRYRAGRGRAGVHYVAEAMINSDKDDAIVEAYTKLVGEAREHAHVVILSPHWDAHQKKPSVTPAMRALGARFIREAGADAVLAHGRHEMQGVELFDGKPVIYDAGNTVLDYNTPGDDGVALLWEASFNKAGVTGLRGYPIDIGRAKTVRATGERAVEIMKRGLAQSEAFGTAARIVDDHIAIAADPGEARSPASPSAPRRPVPGKVRRAPSSTLLAEVPAGAEVLDVAWEGGVQLKGFNLVMDKLTATRGAHQTVIVYLTTEQTIARHYEVQLVLLHIGADEEGELRTLLVDDKGRLRKRPRTIERHLPGDWLHPTPRWRPGEVVQDITNVRYRFPDSGRVAFLVGVRDLGASPVPGKDVDRLVKPTAKGNAVIIDNLVLLGERSMAKDAQGLRRALEAFERERADLLKLSPNQLQ
jgi:poly-gamma-glutamate capsule biosynthesis protein CapA/YwtB (metallophosphatase superfamily)